MYKNLFDGNIYEYGEEQEVLTTPTPVHVLQSLVDFQSVADDLADEKFSQLVHVGDVIGYKNYYNELVVAVATNENVVVDHHKGLIGIGTANKENLQAMGLAMERLARKWGLHTRPEYTEHKDGIPILSKNEIMARIQGMYNNTLGQLAKVDDWSLQVAVPVFEKGMFKPKKKLAVHGGKVFVSSARRKQRIVVKSGETETIPIEVGDRYLLCDPLLQQIVSDNDMFLVLEQEKDVASVGSDVASVVVEYAASYKNISVSRSFVLAEVR